MLYKLSVKYTSGVVHVRASRDGEKLMSKAHELIDTNQAYWVMVSNETTFTVLLERAL